MRGAKLITMEHGECIPPVFSSMSFEENIADKRTTWSIPYHDKHVRLPANKLATVDIQSTKNIWPSSTMTCHAIDSEQRRHRRPVKRWPSTIWCANRMNHSTKIFRRIFWSGLIRTVVGDGVCDTGSCCKLPTYGAVMCRSARCGKLKIGTLRPNWNA